MTQTHVTHVLTTSQRTHSVIIVETAAHVTITIQTTRYGRLGDEKQFAAWLLPIVAKYEQDPRPFVVNDPHLKQQAVVI